MSPLRLRLFLAGGLATAAADPGEPLRVLRATPSGDAPPTAHVTVTFDRPVAGSLDRSVDPRGLLTIEPAVAGRIEWRDPVTLRFRPAAPLASNTTYRVTVANRFEAMDGSRLPEPYSFSFRVRGPRVLAGWPVGPDRHPRFLTPEPALELVLDAPADLAELSRAVYLELGKLCSAPGAVRLRAVSQRSITGEDRAEFREAGGWERDRAADSLRRVVRLAVERPLPRGCPGELVAPASLDDGGRGRPQRWPFATHGDFQLARAACGWGREQCPTGPLTVTFSTPVKGAEVQRHLRITPDLPFTVSDTAEEREQWPLEAQLAPRTWYGVVADPALRDVFGQRLTGNPVATARTSSYAPAVNYAWGRAVVERQGPRTLAVTHVNADTLEVLVAPVPDSLEREFMARSEWAWAELWPALLPHAVRRRFPVSTPRDRVGIFGVPLPRPAPGRRGPTLLAVQVTSPRLDTLSRRRRPVVLVQVTDLGAHARVGLADGVVWVTGVSDGKPRAGAVVSLHDPTGAVLGVTKTGPDGIARFPTIRTPPRTAEEQRGPLEGYVAVALGDDRALVPLNRWDPDLSPWRFNVSAAWGQQRLPVAAAVFSERGIYRPGERVYAKAIVRTGLLGALAPPAPGDSLRWVFYDRDTQEAERGRLQERTVPLSSFGTSEATLQLPLSAGLGTYELAVELRRKGRWTEVAATFYRVAEYRPPEFLVDVATDSGARFAKDSIGATVEARYLFGAPMGRAVVSWALRQQADAGAPDIPGTDGFYIGDTGWWWEESEESARPVQQTASGTDTLDARGRIALRLPLGDALRGRAALATFEATVKDVNRQTVSASASVTVHPAAFYLGAKPDEQAYFWTAGTPVTVGVLAVRPDGAREPGVRVAGTVVRREWHQTHRERDGYADLVGEWVSDTVARCALVSAAEPVPCRFTPAAGGTYVVTFRAADRAGREVLTSFVRWATGKDWVPWNDESQFKMDVIPDRTRYAVGDTATVLFASPFVDADAWVTVEREGLIQQRRLRIASGTTTLRLPITEALAPNAYVSIVVARGRSARPGRLDDPGRPTIRVGYAELRVTPERKRLTVAVEPARAEWRPGDTADVRLRVSAGPDAGGVRSEVTLWAVDEGVLALTGYRTPDPVGLIYRPRGLGLRLASNLVSVAPQIPEGEKGKRAPGGGGGIDAADILRSRFQTTAFFLGSVLTDAAGRATARARLPDNLTTFRVMAVAVTAGDRYGSGQSSLLVTRPLVARPALPRFLRESDRFAAGVVVNRRSGSGDAAAVTASAGGAAALAGPDTRTAALEPGRGREVRFDFRGAPGDSAAFRFDARSGPDADAVRVALPVKPSYRPRAWTVAGMLHDSSAVELPLPAELDPARSELTVSLGTSPLAVIRGAERWLYRYPYACSEQLASQAQPLIALLRAAKRLRADSLAGPRVRQDLERIVATLVRRQRDDGGIGIWAATDWTTPWLSSYAGQVLLDARGLGLPVSDSVLARLGRYLRTSVTERTVRAVAVARWWDTTAARLGERVMAVDWLSRSGRRDRAAENELLRVAPQLYWEDRVRLAGVFARGGDRGVARRLLEPAWLSVKVEGRRATLPDASRRDFYFYSETRPVAWLLSATLAVDSTHPLVGPLVETMIDQSRAAGWRWNTQDWGTAVAALAEFWTRQREAAARGVRVSAGGATLFTFRAPSEAGRDSTVTLTKLGGQARLSLAAIEPGAPVFWYATVREVPKQAPVRPDDQGLQVERWYERLEDGKPVTSVAEGDLVRVRLRITAPAERHFVILDDALPAGLEAVDLSLRTAGGVPGPGAADSTGQEAPAGEPGESGDGWPFRWAYGSWDAGWWSPFDHKELRDDRVLYFATVLWKGTYSATYIARATTPGVFSRPPAHAEEMYNPAVFGRSDGGVFTVTAR
ncbi:MAG TPA: alpha-2-macroglobulin family protein [Gemmatimonadales bacterium]|nr:alpha-2-macroglobulin family protein [Gemmatimonadales bacterium]